MLTLGAFFSWWQWILVVVLIGAIVGLVIIRKKQNQ